MFKPLLVRLFSIGVGVGVSLALNMGAQAQPVVLTGAKIEPPPWQRITLSHHDQSFDFAVYANHDLAQSDSAIEELVIVLHGVSRNGDGYYASAESALRDVRPDQSGILLVAPQFVSPGDERKGFSDLPMWGVNAWASGLDASIGPAHLSSYDVMDSLLRSLADQDKYPSLRKIVFAGHSAGGQFVHRYAVLNRIDDAIRDRGIDLQYVVANPSAFMYFTKDRPITDKVFGPFEGASACPSFDQYRYGTRDIIPYAGDVSAEALLKRYLNRSVTYLMGTADNNPTQNNLDKSCAAKAQGATRIQRARRFVAYERFVATPFAPINHNAYEVFNVGHDQSGMFQSTCGVHALFGVDVAESKVSARCEQTVSADRMSKALPNSATKLGYRQAVDSAGP